MSALAFTHKRIEGRGFLPVTAQVGLCGVGSLQEASDFERLQPTYCRAAALHKLRIQPAERRSHRLRRARYNLWQGGRRGVRARPFRVARTAAIMLALTWGPPVQKYASDSGRYRSSRCQHQGERFSGMGARSLEHRSIFCSKQSGGNLA